LGKGGERWRGWVWAKVKREGWCRPRPRIEEKKRGREEKKKERGKSRLFSPLG
jgi:hypothetical protein